MFHSAAGRSLPPDFNIIPPNYPGADDLATAGHAHGSPLQARRETSSEPGSPGPQVPTRENDGILVCREVWDAAYAVFQEYRRLMTENQTCRQMLVRHDIDAVVPQQPRSGAIVALERILISRPLAPPRAPFRAGSAPGLHVMTEACAACTPYDAAAHRGQQSMAWPPYRLELTPPMPDSNALPGIAQYINAPYWPGSPQTDTAPVPVVPDVAPEASGPDVWQAETMQDWQHLIDAASENTNMGGTT